MALRRAATHRPRDGRRMALSFGSDPGNFGVYDIACVSHRHALGDHAYGRHHHRGVMSALNPERLARRSPRPQD